MPIQYPDGIIKEHLHTRASCGLFDVSHMGQVHIKGKDARALLEKMTVVDLDNLQPGQASLSLLMMEHGGIKDDCIITKLKEDHYYVVLNAACKITDLMHIDKYTKDMSVEIDYNEKNALLAVQGPKAQSLVENVLGGIDLS